MFALLLRLGSQRGVILCACAWVALFAGRLQAANTGPLTEEQKIIHALDRLGFGPRPGDVDRIKQMGLEKYLQQQLHPDRIDDAAVEKKLTGFDALKMTPKQLMTAFHEDQKNQLAQKKAREEAKQSGTNAAPGAARANQGGNLRTMMQDGTLGEHPARLAVGQLQDAKIIRATESNRQLYEVLVDFWSNHFNIDVRKGPCRVLKVVDERDVIRPNVFGKFRDLLGASAKSPAMLFYLDNAQNSVQREVRPMEEGIRERIRQQVPGAPADGKPRKVGGINENYAREIMELHTLGVEGGYTQKDVQEVARCLTGWGIDLLTGEFQFHPRAHDNNEKTVLGHRIPAGGGMKDGEMVLDILAKHPSTAKFIVTKLCRRFVSDDPPPALVARVAAVFTMTDGDLRKVVEAIIKSPEFNSVGAYRTKIKSPFEFAVSAVRATGSTITTDGQPPQTVRFALETGATFGRGEDRMANAKRKTLNIHIIELGQPLYAYQAPTGYPEDSREWINSGALISRMNFALALADRSLIDVAISTDTFMHGVEIDKSDQVLDRLNKVLLQGELGKSTRATLEKQALNNHDDGTSTVNVTQLTALVLGSPEFQRH